MPSVSKAQQKLFGMVHALQTGKLHPSKASSSVRKLAKTMHSSDVKKYATTHVSDLPKKIRELMAGSGGTTVTDTPPATTMQKHISNDPTRVDFDENYKTLASIVETKTPMEINGNVVDVYTATLLTKALSLLSEENKKRLLSLTTEQMVATAYKLITR